MGVVHWNASAAQLVEEAGGKRVGRHCRCCLLRWIEARMRCSHCAEIGLHCHGRHCRIAAEAWSRNGAGCRRGSSRHCRAQCRQLRKRWLAESTAYRRQADRRSRGVEESLQPGVMV
jgi:hypothetical protein